MAIVGPIFMVFVDILDTGAPVPIGFFFVINLMVPIVVIERLGIGNVCRCSQYRAKQKNSTEDDPSS
jgi:hypothetical protein